MKKPFLYFVRFGLSGFSIFRLKHLYLSLLAIFFLVLSILSLKYQLSNYLNRLSSTVKVISAHNLPKPMGSGAKGEVIDPYVVLEMHGVPADCAEQRTRTAAQNQDDPLFDETFEFQVRLVITALLTTTTFKQILVGLCVHLFICFYLFIYLL